MKTWVIKIGTSILRGTEKHLLKKLLKPFVDPLKIFFQKEIN